MHLLLSSQTEGDGSWRFSIAAGSNTADDRALSHPLIYQTEKWKEQLGADRTSISAVIMHKTVDMPCCPIETRTGEKDKVSHIFSHMNDCIFTELIKLLFMLYKCVMI